MGYGKLENIEAIALLSKSILINALWISIVAFIIVYLFCKLLKQFSGQSLLEVSNYLRWSCFKIFYWNSFYYLFYG